MKKILNSCALLCAAWGPRAVLLGASVAAFGSCVRFLHLERQLVSFPYSLNYGEGVVLQQALRIARGEGLYEAPEKEPSFIDNYTPLYPFLVSLTLPEGVPSWKGGRVLSLLGALGCAALLWLLVALLRGEKEDVDLTAACGLIAAGLFLATREALTWGALLRVDFLGVFLSLAGFVCACARFRGAALWASLLFCAAVATRQSLVAAPAAAYLGVAVTGRRREAALGALLFFVLCVVGGAAAYLLTKGGFWYHTVVANVLPFRFSSLYEKYLKAFFPRKLPLLVGALYACRVLRRQKKCTALMLFMPFSFLAALSICRAGADVNYLLEPLSALSAMLAAGILWAQKRWEYAFLCVCAMLQLAGSFLWEAPRVAPRDLSSLSARDRKALSVCVQLKGPILFEEPSLALLSGRPVLYEPFMCAQLAKAGRWSAKKLAEKIRQKAFVAVQRTSWILSDRDGKAAWLWIGDRTVPELAEALARHYELRKGYIFSRPVAPGLQEAYSFWFPKQ